MGRTLQPEDIIAHYRVVGPLGAGGMGEVYLAHDTRLDRDLALKVLPPELVRSEERVKRFILEAKSASSLSHPHIVTIYDIGHHPVRSSNEAEAGGEEVHYIAMELVNGKTMHDHIHNDKTDLKTMLGHLAQAAEGLSKAHGAGIVHRDLKPSNIMVTNDGYAKVLDFGLAKLTEKGSTEADLTSAPTEAEKTTAGTVVGTAGYMSPEQVKGKSVDHRSDIFSFGCILYEAATRTRPFVAESKFDTMHKIVHDHPIPIDEINPTVPSELRRLIKRCLTKNADQRLQSIKDLAIELREVVEEFDTLSVTATSASGSSPAAVAPARSPRMTALVSTVVALGLAGIAIGIWSLRGPGGSESRVQQPFQSMRMRSLMDDRNVIGATLSGDGRYLAYVKGPAGQWSLWVRQVGTGSDAEILAGQSIPIRGVSFSPDGDYLYYLGRDPDTPNYSALFEVPSLGGTPRKRIFDIDTALAFSPDGKRGAFVRGVPQENRTDLMIANLDTGEQTLLASVNAPEELHMVKPTWSPDGKKIVAVLHATEPGIQHALVGYDAASGDQNFITQLAPQDFSSFAWLPDGSGLIASTQPTPGLPDQVFLIPYPEGRLQQITNDLDGYAAVSISSDGASIAALRTSRDSSLWSVPAKKTAPPQELTPRSGKERVGEILALPDGTLVYTLFQDRHRQIWRMNPDGTGKLQLTSLAGWSFSMHLLPENRGIVFTHISESDRIHHIWRIDPQGGGLRQLTHGPGENLVGISRDGETVFFAPTQSRHEVWRVLIQGGEPEKFLDGRMYDSSLSPDGRYLFYSRSEEIAGRNRDRFFIIPTNGGDPLAEFLPPGDYRDIQWTRDNLALVYIHTIDGVQNLWRQPAQGGEAIQVTHFPEGRMGNPKPALDGSRIAVIRLLGKTENVWTMKTDGTDAEAITDFREGEIFDLGWAHDSASLFFVQGEARREVVLIEEAER